jgi:hypothetical protein
LVVFISAFMASNLSFNEKSGAEGRRRLARYSRGRCEKSSKSGTFQAGKIIP